jgi:hypothetical protein
MLSSSSKPCFSSGYCDIRAVLLERSQLLGWVPGFLTDAALTDGHFDRQIF